MESIIQNTEKWAHIQTVSQFILYNSNSDNPKLKNKTLKNIVQGTCQAPATLPVI